MRAIGTKNDNEGQRVAQRVKANDNEWKRMTTSGKPSDSKWQQMMLVELNLKTKVFPKNPNTLWKIYGSCKIFNPTFSFYTT